MKGVHLGRVARAQWPAALSIPFDGVRVETLLLRSVQDEGALEKEWFYLALEGEVVIDLEAGAFVHLRPGEGTVVAAHAPRRLSPVGEAVILRLSRSTRNA